MDYYLDPAPVEGSCFVRTDWGIYVIGGLINGKPTSEVMFFDPTDHTVLRIAPMKMARSGASASCLMGESKIYVFGGCSDSADSSNWAEVYDRATGTWEFLSVSAPPKMPLKIQQSVVLDDKKHVYAVGEDSQIFNFSVTECKFEAAEDGISESDLENKNDWLMTDEALFCRGTGGRILWRLPCNLAWNEVKGLEELQQQHIIKLFIYNHERLAIFWEARPQGPDDQQILELWYAEITFQPRMNGRVWDLWGNIEWSGAVLSSDLGSSSSSSTRPP
ncbi:PREDICTED: F-box/kelch-repeat protein SKIP6-like [Camelina sativa]|uniref:F-box/kelch-repeat protein SKIP6-like n=1 Tax=Camelina sativa TaxID=90675 RepID=A0ABM0Y433_CAMSA|nr:PREDICTED: F-box/kelch-repeat protein SKIP6-like [Camelina sativa]XP_010495139.1 PREDICTED: F-box/kelch-repeat protein SKIP6-like [Camelina sativa]